MITTINRAIAKRRDEENDKGFTLIELLVVVLIIGILAAIAIPAFLNQREGAWRTQVESDLKNAALAAEQYALDSNGGFSDLTTANLIASGFNATDAVTVAVGTKTATTYTLTGTHTELDGTFTYDSEDGTIARPGE